MQIYSGVEPSLNPRDSPRPAPMSGVMSPRKLDSGARQSDIQERLHGSAKGSIGDAMSEVYLDYNASAPLDPRVFEAMAPVLSGEVGNASSVHRFGHRQAAAVDEAREHVARLVGGRPGGVVFTAGATEANNLALRGAAEAAPEGRPRLLVSGGRACLGGSHGPLAVRLRRREARCDRRDPGRVRRSRRRGGAARAGRPARVSDGGQQRDRRAQPGGRDRRSGTGRGSDVPL